MTFAELTPWLFARTTGGIRWGLERVEALLARVGDPHRAFASVLIGGTNGKGSVAALCASALRAQGGGKIGLYTSPHLVSFAERIRIDGHPVVEEVLAEAAGRMREAIEAENASFFEATTALAFLLFAEAGVDLAVVEVGLGGRLDATNVLTPLVTGITNIARDHVEYLGDSLPLIAEEKAGIVKPGVPMISGIGEPELEAIVRERARAIGSDFRSLGEWAHCDRIEVGREGTHFLLDSRSWGSHELQLPLRGPHQVRNAALAAEILAALPPEWRPEWDALARGFAGVRWPGRAQLERIGETSFLFDVAHNPAGAGILRETYTLLELPRPRVLVTAILADKEWRAMLPTLSEDMDAVILTNAPSAPASRSWDPYEAAEWSSRESGRTPQVIPSLAAALDRARALAGAGSVIVTGSVHTVGDALHLLGLPVDGAPRS